MNPHGVQTLVDLMRLRAATTPNDVAFTFLENGEVETGALSYGGLDRHARAVATALQDRKLEGQQALLLYPSGLDFIAAFFGCLYAGVVAVPAAPPHLARLDRERLRLQAIADDAQVTAVLTTASVKAAIGSRRDRFGDLARPWIASDGLVVDDSHWRDPGRTAESLAFLQYTSGSTTSPRGVMVSHANVLNNLTHWDRCGGDPTARTMVTWCPVFHDLGLVYGILEPVFGGFPCYLMSAAAFVQRPMRWLEAMSGYRGTHTMGPNFAFDLCLTRSAPAERSGLDLSRWRVAASGGEPVRAQTMERFAEAFAPTGFRHQVFCPGYGLAEATCYATQTLAEDGPTRCEVEARALEDHRVVIEPERTASSRTVVGCGRTSSFAGRIAIVHPESLTECRPDQVGEIWISGPSVTQGYWNRPAETEYAFGARLADSGEGPFLRTGDLGFITSGELFVTGRLKDLIILSGRNYYPQDIEQSATESHPSLRPGCCAAFSIDDGREEHLVIVAEANGLHEASDGAEILDAIRGSVAEQHELPVAAVVLIKPLTISRTSSGKLRRRDCRSRYLNGDLSVTASWRAGPTTGLSAPPRDAIERQLVEIWESAFNRRPIGIRDDFFDLGGTSLMAASLFAKIEASMGDGPSPSILFEARTIELLAEVFRSRMNSSETSYVMTVRAAGARAPLFVVENVGMRGWPPRHLAELLGADQPFYTLHTAGLEHHPELTESVQTLATRYVQDMRACKPVGPYHLAGICAGGIIAFEMAQQLQAAGEVVGLLAMVDLPVSEAWLALPNDGPTLRPRVQSFGPWNMVRRALKKLYARWSGFAPSPRSATTEPTTAEVVEPGVDEPEAVGFQEREYAQMLRNYSARPYPGAILLVRIGNHQWEQPVHRTWGLGWELLARGGVTVREITGTHATMLSDPHIQLLAQHLREGVDRASEISRRDDMS